jgi:hypothetical protein
MNRYALPALLALLPLLVSAAERRHLRYDNIHDWEVTEIRQKMTELAPGAVVDIDSVYEGCSCEEGSACSAQVWVVSHRQGSDTGVWLSKMNGHWELGPREKWERDFHELQLRRFQLGPRDAPDFAARRDQYNLEVAALQMAKPRCEATASAGTR